MKLKRKIERERVRALERDTLLFEVLKEKCCYCKFNMSCDYRIPFCDILSEHVKVGTYCPFWFEIIEEEADYDE